MKKKKRIFCNRCLSEVTWFKKGRSKKTLICPRCGVLAFNPSLKEKLGSIGLQGYELTKNIPLVGQIMDLMEQIPGKGSLTGNIPKAFKESMTELAGSPLGSADSAQTTKSSPLFRKPSSEEKLLNLIEAERRIR